MKTGFICDSGFNIVVSATRDGRKLVAVVLGEPSTRVRNARAAQLLENGFKRYFWKSLFGTSLDGLALQAKVADGPAHLREVICGRRSQAETPDAPSFAAITQPIKTADLPGILFSTTN